jgi:transposase
VSNPLFAGVDLSKRWFDAATSDGRERRFDNDPEGHHAFIRWLKHPARVVLEATGTLGLDLALALERHPRCEVMIVNPRLIKGFAQATAQRSKTDRADARTILGFAQRMPFEPWTPPAVALVEQRAIARRIADLTVERARDKNRLAALRASGAHSRLVANDVAVNIRHLDRRIDLLVGQALAVVRQDIRLAEAYQHLTSLRGFAAKSAVQILPELLVLPGDMTAKQWVAHAGLDPREHESGSSVRGRVRISKVGSVHLRRALYMPALVAVRSEPRVRGFYQDLIARGKPPMVANVAVMRKLLHALHGMLRHGEDFDGARFRATPIMSLTS